MVEIDEVVRGWYERIKELGQLHPAGSWPDRKAASQVADQAFSEFGRTPDGAFDEAEYDAPSPGGAVRVRMVRPSGVAAPPVLMLIHGGGFAFGSIDERTQRAAARDRAAGAGCPVIDVEYRLAPEHAFPAAIDDVLGVIDWIGAEAFALDLDTSRIAVDGISAGAALAANVALRAGEHGPALCGLVLEIPSIDLRPDGHWLERFARVGGVADRATVRKYYLGEADPADPRASPIMADVSRFPPTHVITAELDPLREGGEVFVARLRAAGVSVTATRHLGATHGSSTLTGVSRDARIWTAEITAALRDFFDGC